MTRAWLALSACACLAVAACHESATPPVVQGASPADSADQFIIGMETKLTDGGLQRADVLADTAYFYDDNKRLEMKGVLAKFYTSTGVEEGRLTSRRATYNVRTELMEAFGNVVIVSMDGRRLTTPQVKYDKAKNLVTSDSAFTATQPDRTMTGIGFDSDPGINTLHVHKLVRSSTGPIKLPDR